MKDPAETPTPNEPSDRRQWERELEVAKTEGGDGQKPAMERPGKPEARPVKSTSSLVRALKKIPLFKGLSPSLIQRVLGVCTLRSCQPDEVLVVGADHPSDEMFILLAGQLGVMTTDGLRLATLTPVMTAGEMGFITRDPRSATVVAIQPSHVLAITRAQFEFLLRGDRDMQVTIYRNIIDILSGKIRDDNVRTRDYLVEKASHETHLRVQRQKTEAALDLLAEHGGMPHEEAMSLIDEKMTAANPRILIADDEPTFRQLLVRLFSPYVVMEAGNGREAMQLARKDRPDLVIADIRMPQMDGFTLLGHLRDEYPDVPVLAISGYVDAAAAQDYDFDAFLEKPVRLDELRQLVEETLTRSDSDPS